VRQVLFADTYPGIANLKGKAFRRALVQRQVIDPRSVNLQALSSRFVRACIRQYSSKTTLARVAFDCTRQRNSLAIAMTRKSTTRRSSKDQSPTGSHQTKAPAWIWRCPERCRWCGAGVRRHAGFLDVVFQTFIVLLGQVFVYKVSIARY